MSLNWTIESTISFISIFPIFFSLGITFFYFLKIRDRTLLYFSFVWLFMFIWAIGGTLSFLLLSRDLFRYHLLALIGVAFAISLLLDSISIERVEPMKLVFFTAVGTLLTVFALNTSSVVDDVFPNGELSVAMTSELRVVAAVLTLMTGFLMFYYMTKIFINAPKELKKYALLSLIGASFMGIISPLVIGVGISTFVPGIGLLLITLGSVFMSIAFVLQPKLSYILPFKAVQLQIIDINQGIALYTHVWDKKNFQEINDLLFSGMITGISHFINETLQRGNIKQLIVDDAVLLVENIENQPLTVVLVANNSSPSLKKSLALFAKLFIKTFPKNYQELGGVNEEDFVGAKELVDQCFPFVPKYE